MRSVGLALWHDRSSSCLYSAGPSPRRARPTEKPASRIRCVARTIPITADEQAVHRVNGPGDSDTPDPGDMRMQIAATVLCVPYEQPEPLTL